MAQLPNGCWDAIRLEICVFHLLASMWLLKFQTYDGSALKWVLSCFSARDPCFLFAASMWKSLMARTYLMEISAACSYYSRFYPLFFCVCQWTLLLILLLWLSNCLELSSEACMCCLHPDNTFRKFVPQGFVKYDWGFWWLKDSRSCNVKSLTCQVC